MSDGKPRLPQGSRVRLWTTCLGSSFGDRARRLAEARALDRRAHRVPGMLYG